MKKFLPVLVLSFLFSVIFWPISALALDPTLQNPIGSISETGEGAGVRTAVSGDGIDITSTDDFVQIIVRFVNWFAWFIAVVSVVMGLYSGFLFITARGNTAQLETARQILVYTIIGIVVAIMSFSIIMITKVLVVVN